MTTFSKFFNSVAPIKWDREGLPFKNDGDKHP